MGSAIGQPQPARCTCPASYSTRRKNLIVVGHDKDCPVHGDLPSDR